jgi:hypothetical protein
MEKGEAVKVLVGENEWRRGTVLGLRSPDRKNEPTIIRVGVGEPHYFNYEEKDFTSGVKRLQEQTDEAHVTNLERDLPIGLELAKEAAAVLLPGETITLKVSDQTISGYHGAVTIDPVQYEQETIGAFIERTGYQVTVWKQYPATRHQPEEYVDAPVGTYPNIGQAVQVFLETIFKLKAEDYWQHKADEAQAAAWEENNAGGEAYIGGY